ncbi:putative integral membrane protein (Pth11) [Aspergillus undulatus]|uniref:putative integral membrane protein (Pth11) n=1 Tax=Aspergillus undulatus TaxID=1810928 RepID=UPI003CCD1715
MGWVYNLTTPDPNDHISRVITLCITFPSVALLFVAARFHVRIWVKKNVWVDDYAALFSAILAMAYAGLAVAQTRWGLGISSEYFPEENDVPFAKMQYAGGPVYTLALLGFKISLLASYLRIGGFVHSYRMVILVAIVACTCNQLIFTIVLSCGCRPIARQWDPSIPGTCINTVASYYGLAITSLVFDVVIIALPLPILAKLQLKLRQKILLGVLFGLGFFVTIIQIIRMLTVKNLQTYANSEAIIIWSVAEISLGVIISCVPTYGPYFRSFKMNISGYRRRRTQGTGASRSYGQTYGLLSRNMHSNIKGTRSNYSQTKTHSTVYDKSEPTTVTGIAVSRNRGGDNDSEESILADLARDSEDRTGESRGRAQTPVERMGIGKGIHIATEVRVERGPRK